MRELPGDLAEQAFKIIPAVFVGKAVLVQNIDDDPFLLEVRADPGKIFHVRFDLLQPAKMLHELPVQAARFSSLKCMVKFFFRTPGLQLSRFSLQ